MSSQRKGHLLCYSMLASTLMLLLGSSLFHRCSGNERKCFIVNHLSSGTVHICYFAPNTTSKGTTREEATKTCATYGASLTTIPTKVIQGVLENYLDTQHITYSFWTAARKIQSSEWKWINGKPYAGKLIKKQFESNVCAAINRNLTYVEQAPNNLNHFVCQFQDERCNQSATVKLNDSCIVKISNRTLNESHARNECLDEGGDLPVIESDEKLNRVTGIFLQLNANARIWMGLRKLWWEWNDKEELKYSNWATGEGGNLAEQCMVVEPGTFKWKQQYCNERERILCQIVSENSETTKSNKTNLSAAIGAGTVVTILVLLIAAILIVIIVKKKVKLPFKGFRRFRNPEVDVKLEEPKDPIPSSRQSFQIPKRFQGNPNKLQGYINKVRNSSVQNGRNSQVSQSAKQTFELQEHDTIPGGHSVARDNDLVHSQGHDLQNSQCQEFPNQQTQNDDHDHYALIPKATGLEPGDEKDANAQKIIVYAQLEFDADDQNGAQNILLDNSEKSTNYGATESPDSNKSEQDRTKDEQRNPSPISTDKDVNPS